MNIRVPPCGPLIDASVYTIKRSSSKLSQRRIKSSSQHSRNISRVAFNSRTSAMRRFPIFCAASEKAYQKLGFVSFEYCIYPNVLRYAVIVA